MNQRIDEVVTVSLEEDGTNLNVDFSTWFNRSLGGSGEDVATATRTRPTTPSKKKNTGKVSWLEVGSDVQIHSLKNSYYNRKEGHVTGFNDESNRYSVHVQSLNKSISVRSANLKLCISSNHFTTSKAAGSHVSPLLSFL